MNDARTEPSLHVRPSPGTPGTEPAAIDPAPASGHGSGRRQRSVRWLIALLALGTIAALVALLWQPRVVPQLPVATPAPAPSASPEPETPRYPIEATAAALPPLDASDAALLAALQTLWSGAGIASFVAPDLVRNIVATVDNLPRRTLPVQKLPVKPAPGSFGTASAGDGLVIGEANAFRYASYVRLVDAVDPGSLVAVYTHHYPLFQQAYRELGFPSGHFNDRLVQAIDVMLASPETTGPLKVVRPKIFYEFADRDLEQLPAGQKLMLRMGAGNAAIVKTKLREIRKLLTARSAELSATQATTPR